MIALKYIELLLYIENVVWYLLLTHLFYSNVFKHLEVIFQKNLILTVRFPCDIFELILWLKTQDYSVLICKKCNGPNFVIVLSSRYNLT